MFIDLSSSYFFHICELCQGKFIFKVVGEKILVVVGKRGKILSCLFFLFFPLDDMGGLNFLRNIHSSSRIRDFQFVLAFYLNVFMLGSAATAIPHHKRQIQLYQIRSQVIYIKSYFIRNHHPDEIIFLLDYSIFLHHFFRFSHHRNILNFGKFDSFQKVENKWRSSWMTILHLLKKIDQHFGWSKCILQISRQLFDSSHLFPSHPSSLF